VFGDIAMKKTQKTIGMVLFRPFNKSFQYLILQHSKKYWNFPKGRVESIDVSEIDTAFREVFEETGLRKTDIRLIEGFREVFEYSFSSEYKENFGQEVTKQAVFYLGQALSDEIVISEEHIGYTWELYDEVRKNLFFKNGQMVLDAANEFLLKKSENLL